MNTNIIYLNHSQNCDEDELDDLDRVLFAHLPSLLVAPPSGLRERVLAMANKAIQSAVKPDLGQRQLPNAVTNPFAKRQTKSLPSHLPRQYRFLAMAAASAATEDTGQVFNSEQGDWSVHTTFNHRDPTQKSVRLYFNGDQASVYDGHEVKLYQGDNLILSGFIQRGQLKVKIPADLALAPPLSIKFD